MRSLEFTKRNIKEIYREPLSFVFLLALPVLLFVVLEIMVRAIGEDISVVPQFEVKHLTISMIVFSFSFITIFAGNLISKDREERFLLRLKSTPMKSYDFILGYTLAIFPFAILQEIVVLITGFFFGLKLSASLLLVLIAMLPVSFIFIGFGILFGSLLSTKAVGGIASIVPTSSALLGGMFFPLDTMTGTFKNVCYAFPFANNIKIGIAIIDPSITNISLAIIISVIYVVAIYLISVIIFNYKLTHDAI